MSVSSRVRPLMSRPNVFSEFTELSNKHSSINLGQGFPDFAPPEFVRDAVAEALGSAPDQQYTRGLGHPRLVHELARSYSTRMREAVCGDSEVLVTVGATEALFATMGALLSPGDTSVIVAPAYDSHMADTVLAGGRCSFIELRAPHEFAKAAEWTLPSEEEMLASVPESARLLVLTSPLAMGKVWSSAELESLARVAREKDLTVVVDEVYERLMYDGAQHVFMRDLEGMRERTVTIGSAGKALSCTGYKIGWLVAPQPLRDAIALVHEHTSFCAPTPLQSAVARVFERFNDSPALEDAYHKGLTEQYARNRDLLAGTLRKLSLPPVVPQAGYFMLARIPHPGPTDYEFSRFLTQSVGVTCIPASPFFGPESLEWSQRHVRFALCKREETIAAACERMESRLNVVQ